MTSSILWQLILVISLQSVRRRRPSFRSVIALEFPEVNRDQLPVLRDPSLVL